MSCGQIALERSGIKVNNYYAAEIDKYAISITKKNYPDTIHLGDVTKFDETKLPQIDLLMGGSPCQGFSFAGKQLNFDDPRSKLFFVYSYMLQTLKPKYFLLENVRMKQEYQDVISDHLGVKPILINSSLVSAQNRNRLYWTNIPNVTQPKDKELILRDILESSADDFRLSEKAVDYMKRHRNGKPRFEYHKNPLDGKASCIVAVQYKGVPYGVIKEERPCEIKSFDPSVECHHVATASDINGHDCIKRVYADSGKSPTLNACTGGNREPKVLCGAWRGRYIKDGKRQDHKGSVAGKTEQRLEIRQDEKTNTLTTVQKDNVVVLVVPEATKKGYTEIQDGDCFDLTFPNSKTRRGRNMKDKSNCLTAANYDYMRYKHPTYRKLTPLECERLQTVPDNYTEGVSKTQRYKMLGNGWTVDVISHILNGVEL
jgi:DNA (cytosine-5)-methyltransferase 3A